MANKSKHQNHGLHPVLYICSCNRLPLSAKEPPLPLLYTAPPPTCPQKQLQRAGGLSGEDMRGFTSCKMLMLNPTSTCSCTYKLAI
ncbi:Hypothetical predicted protein [Podarcis lilfordi]|uniref:Uncharacterized protein n=1 Tax=Podarcis lilfordi TaxID=74358 RepID=A0AA35KDZ9_9SAUR|nr:Hypothetical predicted protein [Podarcis lilfordi]